MKKVLMVAYHYPPYAGGSGIHRTLKFSRYLPEYGWEPIVLTLSPNAYPPAPNTDSIPSGVTTLRAFALDTARHLSFRGAYPSILALPDRWMTWWPAAVRLGMKVIREHRPNMIWSTYPIATAHLIGLALRRWSGLPWVADFRDPMVQKDPLTGADFPADRLVRKAYDWIETRTVRHATCTVFTSPGALSMYAERFPQTPESHWTMIPNGYDEEDFVNAEMDGAEQVSANPTLLIHSGVLYPSERNPLCFFEAVSDLRRDGEISASTLKIVLRAAGHESYYAPLLRKHGIHDIVTVAPPIPHSSAIAELLQASGLLIFQAANCNSQIPAKVYECLRAGRPIFAMTDPAGDTAALLREEGVTAIVPLDSKDGIAAGLKKFIATLNNSHRERPRQADRHSRKARTRELAALMDSVLTKDLRSQSTFA